MENTFRVNYDRIKAEAVKIAAKELRRLRDAPCRASCCHWNRSESATLFHGKSVPSDAEARLPYESIFFAWELHYTSCNFVIFVQNGQSK